MASFDIRYFAPKNESGLCGHGTVAAMKVIFDSVTDSLGLGQRSPFPAFSSPETQVVEFNTVQGIVVSARRVLAHDEVSGKEED